MIGIVSNTLIIAAVFSVLIIVHEFGHFIAARLAGVKVTDFSVGFGPPLFKRKIKETNFLICSIPLGGYIKMAGDSRSESRGYKDEFFAKSPGMRSLIVLAGPLFNYILAFIALSVIVTLGFYVQDTRVGAVRGGSPAYEAGLQRGDRVVAIDGRRVDSWQELQGEIQKTEGLLRLVLDREGREVEVELETVKKEVTDRQGREVWGYSVGIFLYGPIVGEVMEGYPAEEAGIKPGDEILKVNDLEVESWEDVSGTIRASQEDVWLKVKRDGEVFSIEVPVKREKHSILGQKEEYVSLIGIQPVFQDKLLREPFPFSLGRAGRMLIETTALSIQGLWYIATDPSISLRESVAGPIYISYMISKTAELGIVALLQLVALLSIFLFVINLLPIPVFDGGHILFFGIEKLRGKPFSQRAEDILNRIGLVLIMILVFFVFYNDIVQRGPKIWEDLKGTFVRENGQELNSLDLNGTEN